MKTLAQIALAFAIFFSYAINLVAQNESGAREISKDGFRRLGYWYEDSNAVYEIGFPVLRSLPPTNSGMPLNVLRTYVYLDSLLRFDKENVIRDRSGRWPVSNDTLKSLASRFYEVVDYDPVIFAQYRTEVAFKRDIRYVTSLSAIYDNVRSVIKKASKVSPSQSGLPEKDYALYSLLYPDYIARIRVLQVDSLLDKPLSNPAHPYRYRVTAQVVELLKGQVLPPCHIEPLSASAQSKASFSGGSLPCIQFQYGWGNYFDPNAITGNGRWIYPSRDPEFMAPDGGFQMKEGQEAVVFITLYPALYDSTTDYFDANLELKASFNALPIIDGKVRDVNKVWSPEATISYIAWKSLFLDVRERFLSGAYN